MKHPTILAERISAYARLIDDNKDVRIKGKKIPYTSLNGHMSSFLTLEGVLGLRLSAEDRSTFLSTFKSQLMEQHGRVMKEFVRVPEALWEESGTLDEWFARSVAYVGGLKPKPSKK